MAGILLPPSCSGHRGNANACPLDSSAWMALPAQLMPLPNAIRLPLARARRTVCEAVGISRYSWMALNGLDRRLARHLDFDGGVFVEAGANDGVEQSNTYYFEKIRHWRGL